VTPIAGLANHYVWSLYQFALETPEPQQNKQCPAKFDTNATIMRYNDGTESGRYFTYKVSVEN
jgi:hypothetical protein